MLLSQGEATPISGCLPLSAIATGDGSRTGDRVPRGDAGWRRCIRLPLPGSHLSGRGGGEHVLVVELLVQVHWFGPGPEAEVQEFDEDRERDGEIDVALLNVLAEPVGHQGHADEEQE